MSTLDSKDTEGTTTPEESGHPAVLNTKRRMIVISIIVFVFGLWCVAASVISSQAGTFVDAYSDTDRAYKVANFFAMGLIKASDLRRNNKTRAVKGPTDVKNAAQRKSPLDAVNSEASSRGNDTATEGGVTASNNTSNSESTEQDGSKDSFISPLCTLVGILGCGICGSTLIIFLRLYRSRLEKIEEMNCRACLALWSSGIASSILVYLVFSASLTFAAQSPQFSPQPHILLFLCFAASMHSQRTLVWAGSKLETWLKQNDSQGGGTPRPAH